MYVRNYGLVSTSYSLLCYLLCPCHSSSYSTCGVDDMLYSYSKTSYHVMSLTLQPSLALSSQGHISPRQPRLCQDDKVTVLVPQTNLKHQKEILSTTMSYKFMRYAV